MQELKRLRNELSWSQQRLADESGVNKATINQVEQGKRTPGIHTLEKLAAALDAEVGDFFPKAQAPLPFNLGPTEEGRRAVAWAEALQEYIMPRIEKYDQEVQDPRSPHFRTATAAALWVAQVEVEEAMWTGWLHEHVAPLIPPAKGEGRWKLLDLEMWEIGLLLVGPQLDFNHVAERGKLRIKEMNDKPDELAARRLEQATVAAEESRKRLEEWSIAANE